MFREDLSRNFGFILHDVARLLRTTFDRRVRELGLTRSQWWVLNHLFRNNGVTQSELAEILGPKFVAAFLAYKRNELDRFAHFVTDWEVREYTYHL